MPEQIVCSFCTQWQNDRENAETDCGSSGLSYPPMGQQLHPQITLAIADERGISVTAVFFDLKNRLCSVVASSRNLLHGFCLVGKAVGGWDAPPQPPPSESDTVRLCVRCSVMCETQIWRAELLTYCAHDHVCLASGILHRPAEEGKRVVGQVLRSMVDISI